MVGAARIAHDSTQPTRFGLIRHAETEWNRQDRIQGCCDSPLTRRGEASAGCWGETLCTLTWDRILTSDLGRAMETAHRINRSLGLPVEVEAGLREQNWGAWEGERFNTLRGKEQLDARLAAGWSFCPPGGEDRTAVWRRGCGCLCRWAETSPGGNILVVTHEGMLKCLVYRLCGREFLPSEPKILQPGHVHFLGYDRWGLFIEKLNAVALK